MRRTKNLQPGLGKNLLSKLTHYEDEFSGSGDIGEEFEERICESAKYRAYLWYWGQVLFAGHAFGMLGRAVNRQFGAIQIDELIAYVLRLFGAGVKVGCEISCMAVDAGLIKSGEESIAIGGTGGGADTAIVLKPSNTHTFFDTRILEIICKPRE